LVAQMVRVRPPRTSGRCKMFHSQNNSHRDHPTATIRPQPRLPRTIRRSQKCNLATHQRHMLHGKAAWAAAQRGSEGHHFGSACPQEGSQTAAGIRAGIMTTPCVAAALRCAALQPPGCPAHRLSSRGWHGPYRRASAGTAQGIAWMAPMAPTMAATMAATISIALHGITKPVLAQHDCPRPNLARCPASKRRKHASKA